MNKYRHYCELQQRTLTADTFGEDQATWETIAYLWVDIMPLSSQERLIAETQQRINAFKIATRFREDISYHEKMRIKHTVNNVVKYYNIEGVLDQDAKRDVLLLDVTESYTDE